MCQSFVEAASRHLDFGFIVPTLCAWERSPQTLLRLSSLSIYCFNDLEFMADGHRRSVGTINCGWLAVRGEPGCVVARMKRSGMRGMFYRLFTSHDCPQTPCWQSQKPPAFSNRPNSYLFALAATSSTVR